MSILVLVQDAALAAFLKTGIEAERYQVEVANGERQARPLLATPRHELALLDMSTPTDASDLLSLFRPMQADLPVLALTADNHMARAACLDRGADDCLSKPFSFAELMARIRALLRRGRRGAAAVLKVGDLELNRIDRRVHRGGRTIELTAREFTLLDYLMRNAGREITRGMILEQVWNNAAQGATNIVDVYINYLRKKVDDGFDEKLIHTVRGVGYAIQQPSSGIAPFYLPPLAGSQERPHA